MLDGMKHIRPWGALSAVVALLVLALVTTSAATKPKVKAAAASPGCVFASGASAAFCDTFVGPTSNPAGDREGQLNAAVWGVSRQLGVSNLGQGQADAAVKSLQMTGTCPTQTVTIETDIEICNGQLNEVVNDNPDITPANENQVDDGGGVTSLAMYPKQPFDWSGRTGAIVFDVSDDAGGSHDAWPELWVTNTPAPDPFVHDSSWQALPQYGFGIRLDAECTTGQDGGCGSTCNTAGDVVSVGSAITVNNYAENEQDPYGQDGGDSSPQNPATLQVVQTGCVTEPTAAGQLNHFEVDVSVSAIKVYGTNAFAGTYDPAVTPLVLLATIPNANLGFTRGLVWLEDAHYNGNKQVNPKLQAMHTFTWDNVGFDGPALAGDLGFDAPDALTSPYYAPVSTQETNLGYPSTASSPATLTVPGVAGVGQAVGALLTFNYQAPDTNSLTLDWSVNGHTGSTTSPMSAYADAQGGPFTEAISVPLADVVAGNNTVAVWSPQDTLIVSEVDLIMQGAAGSPTTTTTVAPTTTTAGPTTTVAPTTTTRAPTTTTTTPAGATRLVCPVVIAPVVGQEITCTYQ